MLVLIDESGCPGFKLTKGSTLFFVVAMVMFTDFLEAEKASKKIGELRTIFRCFPEFKFNKTRPEIKDQFFETICQFDFKIRALVVNKTSIYSSHLREQTENFYNYFVQMLMQYDQGSLTNASIKIDGSGDREFKQALHIYFRQRLTKHKIKKFKFVDSKSDNLIQLADMVAGAIARSYNPNRDQSDRWLTMLKKKKKIEDIWDFK